MIGHDIFGDPVEPDGDDPENVPMNDEDGHDRQEPNMANPNQPQRRRQRRLYQGRTLNMPELMRVQ